MNGFKRYNGLDSVTMCPCPDYVPKQVDTRDKYQDILDMIFTIDKESGFPAGALNQFMSEKTSAEVKQFIQDYLLVNSGGNALDVPDSVLEGYKRLPSEFIAECSRNRFESVEQYEARISERVNQIRQEQDFKKRFSELSKKLDKKDAD